MPARKYRATWDDVGALDCDFIAGWGVLSGYRGQIDTEAEQGPQSIFCEHDAERDTLSAFYVWPEKARLRAAIGLDEHGPIRSTVRIERTPCRYGGTRPIFVCPGCARRTRRLAVRPAGLLCGKCAGVTYGSQRETKTRRLVRRANVLAGRLGMEHFTDAPKRPPYMREATYQKTLAELRAVVDEINIKAARAMSRGITGLGALARWGI